MKESTDLSTRVKDETYRFALYVRMMQDTHGSDDDIDEVIGGNREIFVESILDLIKEGQIKILKKLRKQENYTEIYGSGVHFIEIKNIDALVKELQNNG